MRTILFAFALLIVSASAHASDPAPQDISKLNAQAEQDKAKKEGDLQYEQMMGRSTRDVVRQALTDVMAHGLRGGHYFTITFLTDYPGVKIPDYLRTRFPKDMPIVLQYEFSILKVDAQMVTVRLAFAGVRETIVIPFDAIMDFSDPSDNLTLHFAGKGMADSSHERYMKVLDEAEQTHARNLKMMDQQQTELDRFDKVLSTWEHQQKQYQSYLDSLKH
jgi:uncharacterized protein